MKSQVGIAQNTREKRNPKLGLRKTLVKNEIPSWDWTERPFFLTFELLQKIQFFIHRF